MLSRDEITARSLRLSGRSPNPYTGTANDPLQEAQSRYAGPGWAQFFGGLQKTEEDAYDAGKNYRIDFSGFGNAYDDGGRADVQRSRYRALAAQDRGYNLGSGDLNPLEEQAQKEFLLSRQANDAIEQAKAEREAQREYNDALAERTNARLAKGYEDFSLSSAFVPANQIARTPGATPTYAAKPDPSLTPEQRREAFLQSVPAKFRPGLEAQMAEFDLKKQAADLATRKQTEVERENKAGEALAANSIMSPEAVDQNAKLYIQTGTMPPLGMKDPNNRQRILNRAAELSAGGGGNVAANKADYKSDSDSLKKLQGQRDAIGAFETTAGKNIDIFLNAAGKVVDTGSPMANVAARMVSGKMLGSPDQAAYDAARQVAINEIAKITSNPNLSGQLSDSARHEVDAFNPQSATLKQTVAVMRLLKQDMGNRVTALDDALTGIRSRIAQPAGGAPPAPSGYVDMIAPDGGPLHVPAADVDKMLKAGAKRKGSA